MTSDRFRLPRTTLPLVRALQLVAMISLVIGIVGLLTFSHAGAQVRDSGSGTSSGTSNPNTYTLSAQANALDVVLTDPSAPLSGDLAYELGPWGASASVDSLGESISDAGAPYSPSIASLPGTVNGIGAGDLPPLPPLPGYVSASYPSSPTNNETQAGYDISSTASASSSQGTVSLGVQPSGSPNGTLFASAQTTANNDGSVSVSASAGSDVLDFGQLFDIGKVSSVMSMTQQADQQPAVTSKTNLGTITLLGQASGLLGSSASLLGINVPINVTTGLIATLNSLLGKAGLKLTYLPETFNYTDGTSSTGSTSNTSKTLQAIDSGALEVSFSQNIPSQGLVSLTATLGRVYVSTSNSAGIAPSTEGLSAGSLGSGLSGTTVPSLSPSIGDLGSVSGTTSPSAPTTGSGPTSSGSPTRTPSTAPAYAIELGPTTESLYLVLVLAALAMLIGVQAMRYLAVRLTLSGRAT